MIDHVDCDTCRTNHPADQACEPHDNGFMCNRVGGGHKLGTVDCPACRVKK